jgi:hypothetical protein
MFSITLGWHRFRGRGHAADAPTEDAFQSLNEIFRPGGRLALLL